MARFFYPSIDVEASGKRINEIRKAKNYSVKELQEYFGFAGPQAIYKWLSGQGLPSVDHLLALSYLFHTPMGELLVYKTIELNDISREFTREVFSFAFERLDTAPLPNHNQYKAARCI